MHLPINSSRRGSINPDKVVAAHKFQVKSKSIHLDGTSMSVEGEYKKETEEIAENKLEIEPEMKAIEIVDGYSRDKRPDLKQFIIDMIVTGDGVYNLGQRKLRQELAKFDDGIRNQVKKITNKPTMRWVFQMFQAVHLVIINGQKHISNLTEEREKIVRHLGKSCSKYYLII